MTEERMSEILTEMIFSYAKKYSKEVIEVKVITSTDNEDNKEFVKIKLELE